MRMSPLSVGSKLLLAGGVLLLVDLFLTWQDLPQPYGARFDVTNSLDGWDRPGLAVGLVTALLLTIVSVRATDVELSPDVPWNTVTLALASAILALVLLKNLTDDGSQWASYLGIVLAVATVVGAFLDRNRVQPVFEPRNPWKTSARAIARASALDASGEQSQAGSERQPAEPSPRW